MAEIHMHDDKNRGGILIEGEPEELTIMVVAVMQSNEFVADLFKRAVQTYDVAKKRGLNITRDAEIAVNDDAEEKYNKLFKKEK